MCVLQQGRKRLVMRSGVSHKGGCFRGSMSLWQGRAGGCRARMGTLRLDLEEFPL